GINDMNVSSYTNDKKTVVGRIFDCAVSLCCRRRGSPRSDCPIQNPYRFLNIIPKKTPISPPNLDTPLRPQRHKLHLQSPFDNLRNRTSNIQNSSIDTMRIFNFRRKFPSLLPPSPNLQKHLE